MDMLMSSCMCVGKHVWRLEVDIECFLLLISTLFFETKSLIRPELTD